MEDKATMPTVSLSMYGNLTIRWNLMKIISLWSDIVVAVLNVPIN